MTRITRRRRNSAKKSEINFSLLQPVHACIFERDIINVWMMGQMALT